MKKCKDCIYCEGEVYGYSGCHPRVNKKYRCQINRFVPPIIHLNNWACGKFEQKKK